MRNRLKQRGRSATMAAALIVSGAAAVAGPARADEAKVATPDGPGELTADPAFGLDPATPQVAALPGGVTPSYGQRSLSEEEWRFDFPGFLPAPLNGGINSRTNQHMTPGPGQSNLVLHAPPVVPDDLET